MIGLFSNGNRCFIGILLLAVMIIFSCSDKPEKIADSEQPNTENASLKQTIIQWPVKVDNENQTIDTRKLRADTQWKWQRIELPVSKSMRAIEYGDGKFLTAGNGYIFSSTDGLDWKMHESPELELVSLFYSKGLWFGATGRSQGTSGAIYISTDGINWQATGNKGFLEMVEANGLLVSINPNSISTSKDAVTWKEERSTRSWVFSSLTFGKGLFVALQADGFCYTSKDGDKWETNENPFMKVWSMVYHRDIFVGIGNLGDVNISSDGRSWREVYRTSGSFSGIISVMDLLIAVGDHFSDACIMVSNDVEKWNFQKLPQMEESQTLTDVVFGNNKLVVLGHHSLPGKGYKRKAFVLVASINDIVKVENTFVKDENITKVDAVKSLSRFSPSDSPWDFNKGIGDLTWGISELALKNAELKTDGPDSRFYKIASKNIRFLGRKIDKVELYFREGFLHSIIMDVSTENMRHFRKMFRKKRGAGKIIKNDSRGLVQGWIIGNTCVKLETIHFGSTSNTIRFTKNG